MHTLTNLPSKTLLVLLGTLSLIGCGRDSSSLKSLSLLTLPENCQQVLLVKSRSWDDSQAVLQRYQRDDISSASDWQAIGDPIAVTVGRSGMGWGRGLHTIPAETDGPVKHEGDGRAPAGIFSLGTAFGYAPEGGDSLKLPYRQATRNDYFVDDVTAKEYNQWVHLDAGDEAAKKRWKSFEWMRRKDELYELGIVVNHNMAPIKPSSGSAIFIHLWSGRGKATAGCTAMSRADVLKLLGWLDPQRKPVLLQVPASELH